MNTDPHHWLIERLPAELRAEPPEITLYDDEAIVMLTLILPAGHAALAGEQRAAIEQQQIAQLRVESRPLRIRLARELQEHLGVPVAWGARCGATERLFTTRTAPVMTRLGRAERDLLDTLVAAGIAETRSAALGYIVRAFAAEHAEWLREARAALVEVERVRSRLTLTPRRAPPPRER
jgi:hypothetical protein